MEQVGVCLRVVGLEGIQVIGQSLECVRSGAQQDVAERILSGRLIGRQEVPFHLHKEEEHRMVYRWKFSMLSQVTGLLVCFDDHDKVIFNYLQSKKKQKKKHDIHQSPSLL